MNIYHYLGITIEEKLNFSKHEDTVYNNVVNRVHRFADIRKYMDVEDALILYKTTLLPQMDYIDIVWDRATVGFSERFQLLQNKALRIIYKVKLEPHPVLTMLQTHANSSLRFLERRRDIHLLYYH